MDGEIRRVILSLVVAFGLYLGFRFVMEQFFPDAPPAATTTETETGAPATTPQPESTAGTATAPTPASTPTTTQTQTTAPVATGSFQLTPGGTPAEFTLGGGEGDALRVELTSRGAAVESIELYSRDKHGDFKQRAAPKSDQPYQIIAPVDDGMYKYYSFATGRIWIEQFGETSISLTDHTWQVVGEPNASTASFQTILQSATQPPQDLLRITKTYRLREHEPLVDLAVQVENLTGRELKVWFEQGGALGIPAEHMQYDMRSLLTAQKTPDGIKVAATKHRGDLRKAAQAHDTVDLFDPANGPLLWTVLANKYFGVYIRPVRPDGKEAEFVADVKGDVVAPATEDNLGDLRARLVTRPADLAADGGTDVYTFEIYAGPKDPDYLREVGPAYVDKTGLYYQLAQTADNRGCCCTFQWLRDLMVWLLTIIHAVVRNYGVAIIVLVIIVRGLLHPLTVFQQKSMFKMQEGMARLQPKMQALKEKYANDKQKQNQEMMKLFGEEGVNPAASIVSFIPMFLQMPILIALWTALNTDIHLRHAPFLLFPGWIQDLSAPDAFWRFTPPITVPILSEIPLIKGLFTNVAGINILPILMGVSMWLQQKYMPKPGMQAKLDAAKQARTDNQPPPKSKTGLTPEEQLRQQQMMMYLMSFIFPLMFYKMPAGLNLYWMSTNIFGICESLIIRKQIAKEKERREKEGPVVPKRRGKGPLSRFFSHIAAQAEELQRKADELSEHEGKKKK